MTPFIMQNQFIELILRATWSKGNIKKLRVILLSRETSNLQIGGSDCWTYCCCPHWSRVFTAHQRRSTGLTVFHRPAVDPITLSSVKILAKTGLFRQREGAKRVHGVWWTGHGETALPEDGGGYLSSLVRLERCGVCEDPSELSTIHLTD